MNNRTELFEKNLHERFDEYNATNAGVNKSTLEKFNNCVNAVVDLCDDLMGYMVTIDARSQLKNYKIQLLNLLTSGSNWGRGGND